MKKLEIESYNVQNLSIEEMYNVDGGTGGWFWQAAVATFLYNCVADWEENSAAYKEGRKEGKKVLNIH